MLGHIPLPVWARLAGAVLLFTATTGAAAESRFSSWSGAGQDSGRRESRAAQSLGINARLTNAPAPTAANLVYGPHSRERLDFWKATSTGSTPVLVYFHPGGFWSGSRGFTQLQAMALSNGISAASADYPLVSEPGIRYLDALRAGARVVQYLRSRSAVLGIDPDRLFVSGGSAGGCIALWVALHDDFAEPASEDPVLRQSSAVIGALAFNAPTSLDYRLIMDRIGGNRRVHPAGNRGYGVRSYADLSDPDMKKHQAELSPLTHVTRGDPPLYLIYGQPPPAGKYPPSTPVDVSVHTARFGQFMEAAMKRADMNGHLFFPGRDATLTPMDFIRECLAAETEAPR